ncbi:sulfatase [Candidatus Poribacteria bacterium]|nr:sulfatase [Candidatus Poribacteria bacterium]
MIRPNILVIFTDQQSATMMSCAENRYFQTPAMDSLAERGTRFERAYCSFPVCIASRFSFMTGRMPSTIDVTVANKLHSISDNNIETVPQEVIDHSLGHVMRAAGYETFYAGKHHFPKMTVEDCGFTVLTRDQRDICADVCADFLLRRVSAEQPFLLIASFVNPHDICYLAIRDSMADDQERRLIENGKTEISVLNRALEIPQDVDEETFLMERCPPLPINHLPLEDEPAAVQETLERRPFRAIVREKWTEKEWRMHRWAYGRLTEMVDAQIGRVLQALRQSGLENNTVVIFTSDHGDHDGARKMEHKTFPYEEAVRVPLIVSLAGETQMDVVDDVHLVSNGLDLLPTLCDYAGVAPPTGLAGASFRGLALGKTPDNWRRALVVESANCRMIRDHQFKYILYGSGTNCEQLFDLKTDPHEMRNLIHNPQYAAISRTLHNQLRNWAIEIGDTRTLDWLVPLRQSGDRVDVNQR